jgi:hypothetical protein
MAGGQVRRPAVKGGASPVDPPELAAPVERRLVDHVRLR